MFTCQSDRLPKQNGEIEKDDYKPNEIMKLTNNSSLSYRNFSYY